MVCYRWSTQDKVWIKECPKCQKTYKATGDVDSSLKELSKYFHTDSTGRTSDGFSPYCKECQKKNRLMCLGVEDHDRETIFNSQNGKCAICDSQLTLEPGQPKNKVAHVDHDAVTGRVRGILCHICNTGLGRFKDNTQLLKRAIEYLDK